MERKTMGLLEIHATVIGLLNENDWLKMDRGEDPMFNDFEAQVDVDQLNKVVAEIETELRKTTPKVKIDLLEVHTVLIDLINENDWLKTDMEDNPMFNDFEAQVDVDQLNKVVAKIETELKRKVA